MSSRREARRRRLLRARDAANREASKARDSKANALKPEPRGAHAHASAETRAERLNIPERALLVLEVQARRCFKRWRLDQAEVIARRVLHFDPRRPRAWRVLGDIAMRRANWEQAFESFEGALCYAPDEPILWCRGAEALFQLHDIERAERWFAKAVRLDASDGQGVSRRARGFLAHHARAFGRAPSGNESRSSATKRAARRAECEDNKTRSLSEKELQAAFAERAQTPTPAHRRKSRSWRKPPR